MSVPANIRKSFVVPLMKGNGLKNLGQIVRKAQKLSVNHQKQAEIDLAWKIAGPNGQRPKPSNYR